MMHPRRCRGGQERSRLAIMVKQRFFVSYTGVKLPLKLVNPLGEAELANRNTYFRADFDDAERLLGFEKMVYGEVEMRHRYEYHPNGVLKRVEITDVEEEVTVLAFDESGAPEDG